MSLRVRNDVALQATAKLIIRRAALVIVWWVSGALCTIAEDALSDRHYADSVLHMVDAINHALSHNRALRQASLSVEEAMIAVHEAHAAFYVQVSPEGGVSTSGDQDTYYYGLYARQLFSQGGEAGVRAGYSSDHDGAYLQFEVRQPLFRNAGQLITQEARVQAHQQWKDTQRQLYMLKMETIIDVVGAYEAVLRFERQVEMDNRAVQRLAELLVITSAKESSGEASRLDTLRVDLQYGEAQTALENSEEFLTLERNDFLNLIGWTQSVHVALVLPPLLDIEPPLLHEALALAFSNRLDYALVLDQRFTQGRQVDIARRSMWPDISAVGHYRLSGGMDNRGALDLAEDNWFAGLTISPDVSRHERRAQLQRSLNRLTGTRLAIEDLEYMLERDVARQLRAYQRAASLYRIALRNTEMAWKRLELAASMFRMGQSDNFSVTDAESAHAAAVQAELLARAEASISGYRLLSALGILLEVPSEFKPKI